MVAINIHHLTRCFLCKDVCFFEWKWRNRNMWCAACYFSPLKCMIFFFKALSGAPYLDEVRCGNDTVPESRSTPVFFRIPLLNWNQISSCYFHDFQISISINMMYRSIRSTCLHFKSAMAPPTSINVAPGRSIQIDDVQVVFMRMDCQNMNGLVMYMVYLDILKYFYIDCLKCRY